MRRVKASGPPPGYAESRAKAQALANELGFDHGIEANAFGWSVFVLPRKQHRQGHELRCEVVMPERGAREGHGP